MRSEDSLVGGFQDFTRRIFGVLTVLGLALGQLRAQSSLTVTSFEPTYGPVGSVVTVEGTGFDSSAAANNRVFFSLSDAPSDMALSARSVPAADAFEVNGAGTSLKVRVPVGSVDGLIGVRASGNEGTSSAIFDVVLLSITLDSDPLPVRRGQTLTLRGRGFATPADDNGVTIGGVTVPVTGVGDGGVTLSVKVPDALVHGGAGDLGSLVVTIGGVSETATTATGQVDVLPTTVDSFNPTSVYPGETVRITGSGFMSETGSANHISFTTGGLLSRGAAAAASLVGTEGTTLDVTVPGGAFTGTVTVGMTLSGGSSALESVTSTATLTINEPEVSDFTPKQGYATDEITFTGRGLSPYEVVVIFTDSSGNTGVGSSVRVTGDKAADGRSFTVTVPAGVASGELWVQASLPRGAPRLSTRLADAFTLLATPTTISFRPDPALEGEELVITGTGFSGVAADYTVRFSNGARGTVDAAPSSVTPTEIRVTVPVGFGTGYFVIESDAPDVKSHDILTRLSLSISFSHDRVFAGQELTITGSGFSVTAADNMVKFPDDSGGVINVTPSSTTRFSLTVLVPAGFRTGTIEVRRTFARGHHPH